jgi:hypothetical protein
LTIEKTSLHIGYEKNLIDVEADFFTTTAPKGNRENDPHDFSFARIPSPMVEKLGNVKYIRDTDIWR